MGVLFVFRMLVCMYVRTSVHVRVRVGVSCYL